MTNLLNLSCDIVIFKYDFINFNFEEFLSADACNCNKYFLVDIYNEKIFINT